MICLMMYIGQGHLPRTGEKRKSRRFCCSIRNDQLSEISEKSDIIRSITGIHQGKYHLYYPEEPLLESAHKLKPRIYANYLVYCRKEVWLYMMLIDTHTHLDAHQFDEDRADSYRKSASCRCR